MQSSGYKRIYQELKELIQTPAEGIQVLEDDNLSEIHAVIHGPAGTPYEGGVFKMKLKLGSDFPQAPPKGFFITKIFHPNVSKTGEICVNTLKKDWKEDLGIKHVLLTVKCLLIVPNPESALNDEAGRLLLENYDEYCKIAKMWTSIHAASAARNKDANNSTAALRREESTEGASANATTTTTASAAGPPDAVASKENSDTTNENAVTQSPVAARKGSTLNSSQKKVPGGSATLDKKRSLKRL